MVTYAIIEGGYEIFMDGVKIITQPHSPNRGVDVLLTPEEAEGLAKLVCAKLSLGADPIVLLEEEQEVISGADDQRIMEMAETYAAEFRARVQEYEQNKPEKRIADLEMAVAAILGGIQA